MQVPYLQAYIQITLAVNMCIYKHVYNLVQDYLTERNECSWYETNVGKPKSQAKLQRLSLI